MIADRLPAVPTVRQAKSGDLAALVELERRCFETDRLSRRQFHYLLTRANASILVAERGGVPVGDAVLLFSRATSMARLYSIAVAPEQEARESGGR